MPLNSLQGLIQASGNSAVAGQSFRNHVAGAVTTANMVGYQLLGLVNWQSSDYYPTNFGNHADKYTSGAVIHWTFEFQNNAYWNNIEKTSAWIVVEMDPNEIDPPTTPTIESITFGSPNTIAVKVYGKAGTGYDDIGFYVIYPSDDFNDNKSSPLFQVTVMQTGAGPGGGGASPTQTPGTPALTAGVGSVTASWTNTTTTWPMMIDFEKWNGSAYVLETVLQKGAGDTSCLDNGLTAGAQYRSRLRYYNSYGAGPYTSYSSAATVQSGTPPSPPSEIPSSLVLSQGPSSGIARASWSNTNTTDGIRIYWQADGSPWSQHDLAANTTQYDESGLNGRNVVFSVVYFNNGGEGTQATSSGLDIT